MKKLTLLIATVFAFSMMVLVACNKQEAPTAPAAPAAPEAAPAPAPPAAPAAPEAAAPEAAPAAPEAAPAAPEAAGTEVPPAEGAGSDEATDDTAPVPEEPLPPEEIPEVADNSVPAQPEAAAPEGMPSDSPEEPAAEETPPDAPPDTATIGDSKTAEQEAMKITRQFLQAVRAGNKVELSRTFGFKKYARKNKPPEIKQLSPEIMTQIENKLLNLLTQENPVKKDIAELKVIGAKATGKVVRVQLEDKDKDIHRIIVGKEAGQWVVVGLPEEIIDN